MTSSPRLRWILGCLLLILGIGRFAWADEESPVALPNGERSTLPQFAPSSGGGREGGQLEAYLNPTTVTLPNQGGSMPALDPIVDGAEDYNRGAFAFNNAFIQVLANPLEAGWKFIFPRPVRNHIRKFGYNLAWPNRLINCMLQNKWKGAGSETARFLINITVGIAGFFDPASKMGLKNYNEDWGQTFYTWGWKHSNFFTIPFMGPSSWRDGLGKIPDAAFNPATYAFGASTFFNFNELSFAIDSYNSTMRSEADPYELIRDVWAVSRLRALLDFEMNAQKSDPSPTLSAVFLEVKDPKFIKHAKTGSIDISETGQSLKYNYWMQDHEAPLVFIIGGAGSFRLSQSTAAHAEMCYDRGFSVVTVSNVFNWEWIKNAASVSLPGYTPIDAVDIYNVLNAIYKQIREEHALSSCSLLGVSLGALDTLFVASNEAMHGPDDLHFSRYIAINPPVDVLYALSQIDNYYAAPLAWPPAERGERIQNTLLKVSQIVDSGDDQPINTNQKLPFDHIESNYLIGLTFHIILRDVIYTSQQRENLGVLKESVDTLARQPVYHEISNYTYTDYMQKFVLPYFFGGPGSSRVSMTKQEFLKSVSLWSIQKKLQDNSKVFVFTNQNDFLLRKQDLEWLSANFSPRFTAFAEGGHLGNLYRPEVQETVMQPLMELKTQNAEPSAK